MTIEKNCTNVLYDGSCPICSLEISQYQKLTPDTPIHWVDISKPEFMVPSGYDKQTLMQRFHVVLPNGDFLSGAAAFVHVWGKLPKWRHLAALSKLPGALDVMEFGYVNFLKIRPKVQKLFG
jgi:predicted DCC family thiol-disulfide oxidoreductase YuxK